MNIPGGLGGAGPPTSRNTYAPKSNNRSTAAPGAAASKGAKDPSPNIAPTEFKIAAWVSRAIWLPVEIRLTPIPAISVTVRPRNAPAASALTGAVTEAITRANPARSGGSGRYSKSAPAA